MKAGFSRWMWGVCGLFLWVTSAGAESSTPAKEGPSNQAFKQFAEFIHQGMPPNTLAFAPDGLSLWSGEPSFNTMTLTQRSLETRDILLRFLLKSDHSSRTVFNFDRETLATYDYEKIYRYSLKTGVATETHKRHGGSFEPFAFSPDSSLAFEASDKSIHLRDIASGNTLRTIDVATLNPNWGLIVSASAVHSRKKRVFFQTFRMAHLLTTAGKVVWSFAEDDKSTEPKMALFSQDGEVLVTGPHKFDDGASSFIARRNLKTGQIDERFPINNFAGMALSPSGEMLMIWSKTGKATIWQFGSKEPVFTYDAVGEIKAAAFSQDDQSLAIGISGFSSRTVILRKSGAKAFAFEEKQKVELPDRKLVAQIGHVSKMTSSMTVSKDGRFLVTGDADGVVWLWDVATRRGIRKVVLKEKAVSGIRFIAPETVLIGASDGVYHWDIKTERPKPFPLPIRFYARQVRVSKDGRLLWLWDGSNVAVVDQQSNRPLFLPRDFYRDGFKHIVSLDVSPDESDFIVGFEDGVILRLNSKSGEELERFRGPKRQLRSVLYADGGKMIIAGFGSKTEKDRNETLSGEIAAWKVGDSQKTPAKPHFSTTIDGDIVSSLALVKGGRQVAVAGIGFKFSFVDVTTGSLSTGIDWRQGLGEIKPIYGIELLSIPGRQELLAKIPGGLPELQVFSVDDGSLKGIFNAYVFPLASAKFGERDGGLVLGGSGGINVWSLNAGKETRRLFTRSSFPGLNNVHPNGQLVITASLDDKTPYGPDPIELKFSHPSIGHRTMLTVPDVIQNTSTGQFELNYPIATEFSESGNHILFVGAATAFVWEMPSGKPKLRVDGKFGPSGRSATFSPNDEYLATVTGDFSGKQEIRAWRIKDGTLAWKAEAPKNVGNLTFSSDGKKLYAFRAIGGVPAIFDTQTGQKVSTEDAGELGSIVLIQNAPEGRPNFVSSSYFGASKVFSFADKTSGYQFGGASGIIGAAYSDDGSILVTADSSRAVTLRQAVTGKPIHRLSAQIGGSDAISFSPKGKFLVLAETDGTASVWDVKTGEEMVRLISLANGGWVAVSPDGRYDSSDPGDVPALSWVLRDEPLTPIPVSVFFKEYYEPRLVQRRLAGETFPPLPDIDKLNRQTPAVRIIDIKAEAPGVARLKVEVESTKGKGAAKRSGVFSLKVFRDGQLVAQAPDLESDEVEVDPNTGKTTLTFSGIKIPPSEGKKDFRTFSAYAFNRDGIKGERATHYYQYSLLDQVRPPRAYIVTIGVNAYENPAWNLRYAAADAKAIRKTVLKTLKSGNQSAFEDVVAVTLIADTKEGQPITATRRHVKAVIDRLAGRDADEAALAEIKGGDKLRQANPEDMVLISYSGHGLADTDGSFHLFPWDIGKGNERRVDDQLKARTITSDLFSKWARQIDAGDMVMIIDACNSAALVEGEGFKPGPMGSSGLGQLAYDKGMRILTASQAENVALESNLIRHGILTYALVQEGLEGRGADFQPQDKKITIGEWLQYGVDRVPLLYNQIKGGKLEPLSRGFTPKNTKIKVDGGADKQGQKDARVQRPSLFDFARKKKDVVIHSLARQ